MFPTYEIYLQQFKRFIDCIEPKGVLIYNSGDCALQKITTVKKCDITYVPYSTPDYMIENNQAILLHGGRKTPIQLIGRHNMENLEGARLVLGELGVGSDVFYSAIPHFKGSAKRLQLVGSNNHTNVYQDFAHSPSKLKATVDAVKGQFPNRRLVACMELHTFSSLNKNFLDQYAGTMDNADLPAVYFSPKAIQHKKLPSLSPNQVLDAFGNPKLQVFDDINGLKAFLSSQNYKNTNLLMMSSGNFSGLDLGGLVKDILDSVD